MDIGTIQDLKEKCEVAGIGQTMIVFGKLDYISEEIKSDTTDSGYEWEKLGIKIDGEWVSIWSPKDEEIEAIMEMRGYEIGAKISGEFKGNNLWFSTDKISLSPDGKSNRGDEDVNEEDKKKAKKANDRSYYETIKLLDKCCEYGKSKVPEEVRDTTQGVGTAQKYAVTLFMALRKDKTRLPEKERRKNGSSGRSEISTRRKEQVGNERLPTM